MIGNLWKYAPLILLGACASAPPPEISSVSIDIPERFEAFSDSCVETAPATMAVDHAWWQDYGDGEMGRLVDEALTANFSIQAAAARLDAAQAQARIAGSGEWPQVDGQLNSTRRKQNFIGLPIPSASGGVISNYTTTYSSALNLSWELDLWGRVRSGHSAAIADLQAGRADLQGARLSIAGQCGKLWMALTASRLQLELAEESRDAYAATANLAWDRYRRGLISSVDVHMSRANEENAASQAAQARIAVEQLSRQLEILLGRYPAGQLLGAPQLPDELPPIPVGLPADLLLRRPDLQAAERRLAASLARHSQSKRELLPQIRLTGSLGSSSDELDGLLDGDFSVWSILGNLVQPIFQGGRLRANVQLQRAQADQNLAGYAQTALNAFMEVESYLKSAHLLKTRQQHLAASAEQAQAAWRLAEDRYRSGLGTYMSVLESQRMALQARSQLISVKLERIQQRMDLHMALGGSFAADTDEISSNPSHEMRSK